MLRIDIKNEINQLRSQIESLEEKAGKDSLVKQFNLYTLANEACNSAEELFNDTLTLPHAEHAELETFYTCLLETLKKLKKTVTLPSQENVADLHKYQQSICYSEQSCLNNNQHKFWGTVKTITGTAFIIAAMVCVVTLPVLTVLSIGASLGIMIAIAFPGAMLLISGVNERAHAETDPNKLNNHAHLSNPALQNKNQTFLTKLSHFTKNAETVGNRAENEYTKAESQRKTAFLRARMT